jgi:hypothetical protein
MVVFVVRGGAGLLRDWVFVARVLIFLAGIGVFPGRDGVFLWRLAAFLWRILVLLASCVLFLWRNGAIAFITEAVMEGVDVVLSVVGEVWGIGTGVAWWLGTGAVGT